MIYTVEVKVQVIRQVVVEASTIDDAERLGLEKAKALLGGADGSVISVQNFPHKTKRSSSVDVETVQEG